MTNVLRDAFPENSVLRAETLRAAAARSRLYVIFLTPRSGSTWLTELAMNTGALGAPQEWFNEGWILTDYNALGCVPPRPRGTLDVNAYVDEIVDEGRGVAGLELSMQQALLLRGLIDGPFDPSWLKATFYLRRRDIAAQAVSLYRSVVSNRYHSYQRNSPKELRAFANAEYDRERLLGFLGFIIKVERTFGALFKSCGLAPIPLLYEDLEADPLAALRRIALAIGVEPPERVPPTTLKVMRDETSAVWRERLMSDLPADMGAAIREIRPAPGS